MKEKLTIIGTIILSLIITFVLAETFSLYHFGTMPTTLTCIYLVSLFCIWEYILLSISYIIGKKMKKERIGIRRIIAAILFLASLLSILGFVFMVDIDWLTYYSMGNSAPFYTFVLLRGLEFLLPTIVLMIIGIILFKKINK